MSELHRRTELARECPNCLTMGGHWKECPKESGWVSRALEAEDQVKHLRADVGLLRSRLRYWSGLALTRFRCEYDEVRLREAAEAVVDCYGRDGLPSVRLDGAVERLRTSLENR